MNERGSRMECVWHISELVLPAAGVRRRKNCVAAAVVQQCPRGCPCRDGRVNKRKG